MSQEFKDTVEDLALRILALPEASLRLRVAIAGPPGSGKSTLAEALVDRLNRDGTGAALVPMDGFHLDNRILEERGLMRRKGAPETFDGAGFLHMVRRLGTEAEVAVPVFDRARDIAIAGAEVLGPEIRIAVVEGNYLLLGEAPWQGLRGLWDFSVFLDTPLDVLEDRLIKRWLDHGMDYADARVRARSNDLPNAERVLSGSKRADLTL